MKVLITGGSGFIGGHAVKHFVACGDDVTNVDALTYAAKKNSTESNNFVKLNVSDRNSFSKLLSKIKPDFVLHFAAETHVDNSIKNYESFIKSNVEGTTSVAMSCSAAGIKLCHISTDEVYGPAQDNAYTENDKLNPMNPYAASKAAAELMLNSVHNTYGLQYVIVRPSNNYGPEQHKEKFIPKLLECLNRGEKFPLYGDGSQVREWTYVKDTVSILRKLILKEDCWSSTYNLSSKISMTNLQVIQKVIQLYDRSISIENAVQFVEDRKGHDKKYSVSTDKLSSIVQHQYVNFDEGILELLHNGKK